MMRGKTLEQIETLPTRESKVGNASGYVRVDPCMGTINKIIEECKNVEVKNVCVSA